MQTVLVVEDNPDVLEVACVNLCDLGYETIAAQDGSEALTYLQSARPIDILFSDVVMPGLDGFKLAEEARRMRPQLKVLLTSGYAEHILPSYDRLARDVPPVLPKPYRLHQLAKAISSVL